MIVVRDLGKSFRTYKKQPGFLGAVKGLWRRKYEWVHAVKKVSFTIAPGEFVGFVGPNGAGKTTTLKMLSGLLFPTSGSAEVLGYIPWERKEDYRRQFALLLGQKNQLWWDLPARESFELNRQIYSIPRPTFEKTLAELTELLQVKDQLDVMVRELSLGERMKMELLAALLHQPKILFLDEPTIGLDVVSQKKIRDFLRHHNRATQTTILLTSHYMTDIAALCERVIIIDQGTLFFDGRLSEVIDRFADVKIVTLQWAMDAHFDPVNWAHYGEVVEAGPARIQLKIKRDRVIPVCQQLLASFPVTDLEITEVPIEDIIRQVFSQSGASAHR